MLNPQGDEAGVGDEGVHRRESAKLLDEKLFAHHYDNRLGCKTL